MRRIPVRSELCGWAGKRLGQTGPRSLARPHPPDRLSLYCILPPVQLYCPSVELYWSPAPLCFLSWCLVAAAPPLNIRHLQHSNPLNCATVHSNCISAEKLCVCRYPLSRLLCNASVSGILTIPIPPRCIEGMPPMSSMPSMPASVIFTMYLCVCRTDNLATHPLLR